MTFDEWIKEELSNYALDILIRFGKDCFATAIVFAFLFDAHIFFNVLGKARAFFPKNKDYN